MNKFLLCAFTLVTFSFITFAQKATLKETQEIKPDFLHEIFKPTADFYTVLDYAGPHGAFSYNRNRDNTRYILYDKNLEIKYSAPIEGLKKKEYLGGLEKPGAIHIFFQEKNEVFVTGLDLSTGQLSGTPVSIYKREYPSAPNTKVEKADYDWFYKGYSVDSSYAYAISSYPINQLDQKFDGAILDNLMKPVKHFSVNLEEFAYAFESIQIQQNSDGTLFIISSAYLKKARESGYRPTVWVITEIDKNGKSSTNFLKDLPEGRIDHMAWQLTQEGLTFSGLRIKKAGEDYTSVVSGQYNSWKKQATNISEISIAETILGSSSSNKIFLNTKSDGLPYSYPIKSFCKNDGTHYIIMHEKGSSAGLLGKSIIALSVTPGKKINWIKRVDALASTMMDAMPISGSAVLDNNNGLYLFYNNYEKVNSSSNDDNKKRDRNKKEDSPLVPFITNIKSDGTLTTIIAGKYADTDHLFANIKPSKFSGEEFIFTSFRYKNGGKSTHKIGVISIK